MIRRLCRIALASCFLALLILGRLHAAAVDGLHWDHEKQTLDADLTDAPLIPTLEDLAMQTGWHIYLEPAPGKTFTTKFTGLSRGTAMRTLIGDMNYAFIPDANGPTRLLVFRTSREAATVKIVGSTPRKHSEPAAHKVGNQLIVKLKPGAKIEEIAAKLGAKVKGRIGDLNAYLLEFEDSDAVEKARTELASNDDVDSTDYNYYVDPPDAPQPVTGNLPPPVQLRLNPGSAGGNIIVGLIDTATQPLGGGLDQFLLPQISVAGAAELSEGVTHGTAIAETILRALQTATAGNTGVQILPVDVYGPNEAASTFDVANGIIRAINSTPSPNIINLSMVSSAESTFLRRVIQQATGYGVIFTVSAGNTPITTPLPPSMWPEVYSVTASDAPGQLASYANRASTVDIMAPGNSVVYLNGMGYLVTGTSVASAYVAGLAAGIADSRGISPQEAVTTVQKVMPFRPPTPSKQ